ncbi:MAG: hypothetical protein WDZ88_04085 [Candidatus Paceibacterota bacterium]
MGKYKIVPIKVSGRIVGGNTQAQNSESTETETHTKDMMHHVTVVEKAGARAKKVAVHTESETKDTHAKDTEGKSEAVKLKIREESDDAPAKDSKHTKSKKKTLKEAPEEAKFHFNNGPAVKNLMEFRNALEAISDEQFNHHVEGKRNDFVRWINEVLEDTECANGLCDITDRGKAIEAVRKHIEE